MTTISPSFQGYSLRVRQEFREDYSDMRSWGLTHDQIAARLGIQRGSLMRRCARHDIYIPEPHERVVFESLDRLIDSGQPFTTGQLPVAAAHLKVAALRHAQGAGRIECLGFEPGPHGGMSCRPRIWRGIMAELAVSA